MGTEAERPKDAEKLLRDARATLARVRLSLAMIGSYHHSVGLEVRENIMAIANYLGDTALTTDYWLLDRLLTTPRRRRSHEE